VDGAVVAPSQADNTPAQPPTSAVQVSLISDLPRLDTDGAFFTETDQSGHFSFVRVPPGTYHAFATQDVEAGLWQNRAFVDQLRAAGAEVTVAQNGHVHVDITVLAANEVERALAAIGL